MWSGGKDGERNVCVYCTREVGGIYMGVGGDINYHYYFRPLDSSALVRTLKRDSLLELSGQVLSFEG